MRFKFGSLVASFAMLGTAVAVIVEGQQVSLALLVALLAFFIAFFFGNLLTLPREAILPYLWFVLASIPGVILYLWGGSPASVPAKQYVGILVLWIVVWVIFRSEEYSPDRIFLIYLRLAKFAACIGVIQEIAYLLDIEKLYDLRWVLIGVGDIDFSGNFLRVHSLFTEPSYFAAFLMPAVYFSMLKIVNKSNLVSFQSCLLYITALICTFSAIGYIGLIFCIIISMGLKFKTIIFGIIVIGFLVFIAQESPVLSSRLLSISSILNEGFSGDENLSVFINYLNLNITKDIFLDHPIFGLGLGAYRVYSESYLGAFISGNLNLIGRTKGQLDLLTLTDGGSMYLRIIAELGALGCIIFIYFYFLGRRKIVSRGHRDIANSALVFIAIFSLRSGQIVRFDFIFFCALYFLIWVECRPSWFYKNIKRIIND